MRPRTIVAALGLTVASLLSSQAFAEVTEKIAKSIALNAAGCKKPEDCEIRGGSKDGQWVFVVSFVKGRTKDGQPVFVPGGWTGITLDAEGNVVDKMPGA